MPHAVDETAENDDRTIALLLNNTDPTNNPLEGILDGPIGGEPKAADAVDYEDIGDDELADEEELGEEIGVGGDVVDGDDSFMEGLLGDAMTQDAGAENDEFDDLFGDAAASSPLAEHDQDMMDTQPDAVADMGAVPAGVPGLVDSPSSTQVPKVESPESIRELASFEEAPAVGTMEEEDEDPEIREQRELFAQAHSPPHSPTPQIPLLQLCRPNSLLASSISSQDTMANQAGTNAKAQERLSQVSDHISSTGSSVPGGKAALLEKHPDDIVVTCALRTPITKGGKGGFKDTQASDLLVGAFKALIARSKIDPSVVEDVAVGTVLAPGGGATEFRAAAIAAGFPLSSGVKSLNRQCSSGLQACVDIANAIKAGMIEVGVGAGVESMSTQYGPQAVSEFSELLDSVAESKNCKVPMGVLSEAMAKDKGVQRAKQDAFAAASFQKAEKAQKEGLFDEEIVPLDNILWQDPKTDEEKRITVAKDDGVRPGMTAESLGKIRPAFAKDGSIHAGNASQVSDGAAAVLLMKRSTALRLGQPILGKFVQASVVGVPPLLMGVGPAAAIPVALQKTGLSKDDVDIYEINEAFASQCVFCIEELGLDVSKVNPKGGAIAFGHPLGCTGARQVSTLLYELRRRKQQIGVTSMCVGTGMGMAAVWVAE